MEDHEIVSDVAEELEGHGTSAYITVADHLTTVASNGAELESIESAIDECEALIEAAQQGRELLCHHLTAEQLQLRAKRGGWLGEKAESLTHAEVVDAFPILRGVRGGFSNGRMASLGQFLAEIRERGSGAHAAGELAGSLCAGSACLLHINLARLDIEHRQAFARLMAEVAERGVK